MPLVAAAVIPALPQLGTLLDPVTATLDALPDFRTAVLLAAGSEPLLHDVAEVAAVRPGGPPRTVEVHTDTALLTAIVRLGQAPRVQSHGLEGPLGVLALHLDGHRPGTAVVPMTVPDRATAEALDGIATGLGQALREAEGDTVVLAVGDLAGTAPTAEPTTRDDGDLRVWDEQAAAALAVSDLQALAALGPEGARRVGAAGWAPLTVLLRILERAELPVAASTYQLLGGAGWLVASTVERPDTPPVRTAP